MNTYVISQYALDTSASEESLFAAFASRIGIVDDSIEKFRELALKATSAVLHGHYSTVPRTRPLIRLTWSRDYFLGGSDKALADDFRSMMAAGKGIIRAVLDEKKLAMQLWKEVEVLSKEIKFQTAGSEAEKYLKVSSRYGSLLYQSIAHSWIIMLLGAVGDAKLKAPAPASTSTSAIRDAYDIGTIKSSFEAYDAAWATYLALPETFPNAQVASLYVPYEAFGRGENGTFRADYDHGTKPTLDYYRTVVERAEGNRLADSS